jgi:type IV pilus assembly protein PilW
MMYRRSRPCSSRIQRGLSLVELMVGITVGLFVVAAAATLVAGQLGNNRQLLIETQVQQDMRASMDIMTRQLRRAGAMAPAQAETTLATPGGTGGARNIFEDVTPATPAASSPATVHASEAGFSFYLNASDQGPFGFKLEDGIVKTRMGASGWQELTDANVLEVTQLDIKRVDVLSDALPCSKLCADGTSDCWPRLVVRTFEVSMAARARSDHAVQRTLSDKVRLRNDWISFNVPGLPAQVCPL